MNEVFLSDDEISTLQRLIGAYPWEVVAQSFDVSMDAILTSNVDGPFGIAFTPKGRLGRGRGPAKQNFITIENSLRDLPGAYDMPKLIVQEPDTLSDIKVSVKKYSTVEPTVLELDGEVFSTLDLTPLSSVESIEIWSTVLTPTNEDSVDDPVVASDTGLWIKLADGRSLVFAVNDSILCNVQLAIQSSSQNELLAQMSLRRTLTAPLAKA